MFFYNIILSLIAIQLILPYKNEFIVHLNEIYTALLIAGLMGVQIAYIEESKGSYHMITMISVILLTTYAIRNQSFVGESEFLKGMIEHHQLDLVMAKEIKNKPNISTETMKLADDIILHSEKEIQLMKNKINNLNVVSLI
jgi:hypothetical protein